MVNSNLAADRSNWKPYSIDVKSNEEYVLLRNWNCHKCGNLCLLSIDITVIKPFKNLLDIITGIPLSVTRTIIPACTPVSNDDTNAYFFIDNLGTYGTFPHTQDYVISGFYVSID